MTALKYAQNDKNQTYSNLMQQFLSQMYDGWSPVVKVKCECTTVTDKRNIQC